MLLCLCQTVTLKFQYFITFLSGEKEDLGLICNFKMDKGKELLT